MTVADSIGLDRKQKNGKSSCQVSSSYIDDLSHAYRDPLTIHYLPRIRRRASLWLLSGNWFINSFYPCYQDRLEPQYSLIEQGFFARQTWRSFERQVCLAAFSKMALSSLGLFLTFWQKHIKNRGNPFLSDVAIRIQNDFSYICNNLSMPRHTILDL